MVIILKGKKHQSIIGIMLLLRGMPGMYYGRNKSLTYMDVFLSGYGLGIIFASPDSKNSLLLHKDVFTQFQIYFLDHTKKYNKENYLYNDAIDTMVEIHGEEKAFDLFFELWDEFVKEKGIVFEWDEEEKS